jgi:plastocyanin
LRTTVTRPSASRLLAIGIAVLALAGCGGGRSSNETSEPRTTTVPTAFTGPLAAGSGHVVLTVPISTSEFAISPQYTRLSIPGIYEIDITNEGRIPHAIVIERNGIKVRTPPIPPGESTELKVNLTVAGTYEVYCPVDHHRAKGMKGEITMGNL